MLTAVPVGVGIYAWGREPRNRFGALLVATGFLWGLTSLSASDNDVVYSIGRVSLWVAEVALLYTMLAYPDGSAAKTGGAGCGSWPSVYW